jgi:predicted P-loop ATPase
LRAAEWDGKNRIDTLLIDYLGANDTEYIRTVTRKTLVAAVTRIMRPGIKFDNVLTLVGEEGKMKSMLFDLLANPWFSDSLTTVQGKEAFEQIHGYWIIEMGEMSALSRAENEQVKHFLSKRVDSYRAPYGRNMVDYPRSNIFVASTNKLHFLKGMGGDRRFWPAEIDMVPPKYKVSSLERDRDTVTQIWAEAMEAFREGEKLFLEDRLYYAAKAVQEQHTIIDVRSSVVKDYLDMELPGDWYELDMVIKRAYIKQEMEIEKDDKAAFKRDKICIREIWAECFGKPISDISKRDSDTLAHIMDHMRGWKRGKGAIRIKGLAGKHVAWERNHIEDNS